MNYTDMNLKINTDVKTISIQPGKDINILTYLPIEDKNDLIQIVLQQSEENGLYNLIKIKMFFELYLVYLYTDIKFTDEEKEEPARLYDELKSNNIIDMILSHIDPIELGYLESLLDTTMEKTMKYTNTIGGVIRNFIGGLVPNAEKANEIIKNFNPEQFEHAMEFVKALNNGQLPQ